MMTYMRIKKGALDYIDLEEILKWRESKSRVMPKKRIPNKTSFYSEPDLSVESPRRIDLDVRLDFTQKGKIIGYIDEKQWFELREEPSDTFICSIWIETLNFDYRASEHEDKPWVASVGLLCSGCV